MSQVKKDDPMHKSEGGCRSVSPMQVEYSSADGSSTIRALALRPNEGISLRGVVQIVHGMAEHVRRYEGLATFLSRLGFVVCGNDHVGHGGSVSDSDDLGHIPLRSADGNMAGDDILVEDVHSLRLKMQDRFPDVPYVIFGHSMGSFVVRAYIARHGEGLAAAILCGTGQQPRLLSAFGFAASRLLARLHGERFRSRLIDSLGVGAYAKKVPDAQTGLDWISPERDAVDEYITDPECGQMFTVGGYAALTGLTGRVVTKESAEQVPKDLPLLFIAGEGDPVGDFGRGVRAAAEQYRAAGVKTVDVRLFPGMRHEIVNRPEGASVREFVDSWLSGRGI